MLIVSNYKDYYDSAVGMGIDKTIVYTRHENEIDVPKDIHELFSENAGNFGYKTISTSWSYLPTIPKGKYEIELFVVGFCGKLHVGCICTSTDYSSIDKHNLVEYVYDHDKLRSILSSNSNKYLNWGKSNKQHFDDYLFKIKSIDPIEIFRKYNAPIFIYRSGLRGKKEKIYINPCLKEYGFMKIHDPFTAFQEIQMFVSGVLGNNENAPQPEMTEKQKIAQHGMDKWSFRKEPLK